MYKDARLSSLSDAMHNQTNIWSKDGWIGGGVTQNKYNIQKKSYEVNESKVKKSWRTQEAWVVCCGSLLLQRFNGKTLKLQLIFCCHFSFLQLRRFQERSIMLPPEFKFTLLVLKLLHVYFFLYRMAWAATFRRVLLLTCLNSSKKVNENVFSILIVTCEIKHEKKSVNIQKKKWVTWFSSCLDAKLRLEDEVICVHISK